MIKGTPNGGINGTLANGLLVHYCFTNRSLLDLSGNGYHLTQVGTVYNATDKDGYLEQAKEITSVETYDGIKQYISVNAENAPSGIKIIGNIDISNMELTEDGNIIIDLPFSYTQQGEWLADTLLIYIKEVID